MADWNPGTCERIDHFVASTRNALFVRRVDSLLLIRPDKTMSINATAIDLLEAFYDRRRRPAAQIVAELAERWRVPKEQLLEDAGKLIDAVGALLNEDYRPREAIRFGGFDRSLVQYPTLSEIAVTYGCQNRCQFCYASSPHREKEHKLMSTDEVCLVMDKIYHQAHVPSLSFTGGEATLRPDLPALIRYGDKLGLRVNLISNGIRLADADYAKTLATAGLASAQISLEAATPELHDIIVGRSGAFLDTVAGVKHMQALGLHVHINTTLNSLNLDVADDLIRFAARTLKLKTLSMNMVIRTGEALRQGGKHVGVTYTEVGERLPALIEVAKAEGIRFVWYSPIPYCIFNPVLHGMGAKSCACVDGILSVDPAGQVLPCSSFAEGIGSLLKEDFEKIYKSRAARYWREKRFSPPVCQSCPDVDICGGACPLYWDAAGSFDELPRRGAGDSKDRQRWERSRRKGHSFGVQPTEHEEATWAP